MTLEKAINTLDILKPNAYSDELKTQWINKLESIVQAEVMKTDEIKQYTWSDDAQAILLVEVPYDDIYLNYLTAMVDYYNNDISSYQNSMTVFNNTYNEYLKYYRRTHESDLGRIKNYW